MTETEMVEVLYFILKKICVLISRIFFQVPLNMFLSKFSSQKLTIAIGIFYSPPNAIDFLNTFSNNFQQIDNKTNEMRLQYQPNSKWKIYSQRKSVI